LKRSDGPQPAEVKLLLGLEAASPAFEPDATSAGPDAAEAPLGPAGDADEGIRSLFPSIRVIP
jgi:hypothetical protein